MSPARLSVLATPTGQQRRGLFIATNGRQRSVKRITVSELQQSICLTKRNRALDISARGENTHLARTEAYLTIQRLPSLVHPSLFDKLGGLIETSKTASSFCRDQRNRQLAHYDLDLALKRSAEPLPEATLEKVNGAITALGNILNALSQYYVNSTTLFDLDSHPGGAASLIRVIQDGMHVKSERLKMLERWEIPPPREAM